MNWPIYALGAIESGAFADFSRKFGATIKNPFVDNLIFQTSAFLTTKQQQVVKKERNLKN